MHVSDRMSVPVLTISPETTHHDALRLMQERSVHHLPVANQRGHLLGIVAERDLLLAAAHYVQAAIEVSEIMQRDVVAVMPDTPLTEAAALMVRYKIGGLPVLNADQEVVGMITETDLFSLLVSLAETTDLLSRVQGR